MNDVGFFPLGAEVVGYLLHPLLHVGPAGNDRDALHTQEAEKEIIAGSVGIVAVLYPLFQHQMTVQASLTAQASVSRQWLDCTAPQVMTASAPYAMASANEKSSFLVLLPPPQPGRRSSRLIQKFIFPPKAAEKFFNGSMGVGS